MREERRNSGRGRRGPRRRKNKEDRTQRVLTNVLLGICIIIFLISAVKLFLIYNEYRVGNAKNTEIQEQAITIKEDENVDKKENVDDTFDYKKYVIDFDFLKEKNDDVIGWILFEEPSRISYPILQGASNDTYLRTDMDMEHSTMGCIFMDVANSGTYRDDNTIIYGHNMRDKSMFGTLSSYQEQEFYDQYPYFYIYTADGVAMKYEIAAVSVIEAKEENYRTAYADDAEYEAYLNMVSKASQVETRLKATTDSSIVTLSTCSSNYDVRLVVQGVRVEMVEMGSGASVGDEIKAGIDVEE